MATAPLSVAGDRCFRVVLVAALSLSWATTVRTQSAHGTIVYQSESGPIKIEVKHALLVKFSDRVFGTVVRQVILSTVDLGPALRKCRDMAMCSSGILREGITLTFDAMPVVPFWFVASDQRVQYSGVADRASVELTADTPERLAGRWRLPATRADGLTLEVEFDASVTKEPNK